MPQFIVEDENFIDDMLSIRGESYSHLKRARRVKIGDSLVVRNHRGKFYEVRVARVSDDSIDCYIVHSFTPSTDGLRLNLYLSLLKGVSFETVLQKAVELGVTSIVPLITERTIPRIEGKFPAKQARWEKIVHGAYKQCMRDFIPELSSPITFEDVICSPGGSWPRIVAHPGVHDSFGAYAKKIGKPEEVDLLIGPEGGFSEREIELAKSQNWKILSFGKNHLRAETAGVAIPSILLYEWG